ncbi:MAG: hypothetical protein GC203_17285 [Phenylobacterium sp.]|uniref:hypothetical protein n=1 Tax=Phenylobacterium sp. TaxID=1871053 RepID=UPI0025FC18B4|nr:hypothetical protein [Phenylobacterium sp.]MBI1199617.1 hypothetical protein [Phenylobacterium sp.]
MKTFKPRSSAWVILVVLCAPVAAIGIVGVILSPADWPYGLALVGLAASVVGYNFTARLVIEEELVTFRRYGRIVWRAPRQGARIEEGRAGDVPFLPALIVRLNGAKVGYVAKGWFDDAALAELRRAFAA